MSRLHACRRWIAGLVAAAMLLVAPVAPAFHKPGDANPAAWSEICTADGLKSVDPGPDGPGGAPAAEHGHGHCVACPGAASALGMPASVDGIPQPPDLKDERPLATFAVPRALAVRMRAQPRAPPLLP